MTLHPGYYLGFIELFISVQFNGILVVLLTIDNDTEQKNGCGFWMISDSCLLQSHTTLYTN